MSTQPREINWADGEGYNRYIREELRSFRRDAWKKQIGRRVRPEAGQRILDVGTGPGFFACILAEEGFNVTAIDNSDAMLTCAASNAKALGVAPDFIKMDLEEMSFPDESFAAVICRNVTWTLRNPEKTYRDFYRLLKPGGALLIYDANWHMYFFDEGLYAKVRERERQCLRRFGRDEIVAVGSPGMFREAPLTSTPRPAWDKAMLETLRMDVSVTEDVGRDVYEPWEKYLYAESPLFEIYGVKTAPGRDCP